jgi:hypothetical protein
VKTVMTLTKEMGYYPYLHDQAFFDRGLLLTMKQLNQGFLVVNLKLSLRKCYGRNNLVNCYGISVSQLNDHGYTKKDKDKIFVYQHELIMVI